MDQIHLTDLNFRYIVPEPWSKKAKKNEAFSAKSLASFKPNSIVVGTIYHFAMERGWKPDAGLVLDGTAPKKGSDIPGELMNAVRAVAGVGSRAPEISLASAPRRHGRKVLSFRWTTKRV